MKQEDKSFVIQQHTADSGVHWDFMLESAGSLRTYRLDKPPQQLVHSLASAVKIFDHPLKFLTYEGPVNEGHGTVRLAESGTYKITSQENDRIEMTLTGKILNGSFTLTHIEDDNWQFCPDTGNLKRT